MHAPDVFVLRDVAIGGQLKRALIVPQPSRMAWTKLRIPARARLTGSVGILSDRPGAISEPAVFVIGISDGRFYELLLRQELDARPGEAGWRWLPIDVDLSEYGGWKWSLFYQPSRKRWSVTVSVYGSGAAAAAWAELAVRVRRPHDLEPDSINPTGSQSGSSPRR